MSAERDLTDGAARFQELERVAELRWKDGKDIVVAVKDCGNGPAIDVREYVTRDAYADGDFDIVGKGSKGKRQKAPYIGPTRNGFWISIDLAGALADAVALATITAGNLEEVSQDA